ncbi:MAG: hypothetical protein GQ574_12500 [Crocinitomix sp.]|nr:hypothetical protein [Crocinitomix sp.]
MRAILSILLFFTALIVVAQQKYPCHTWQRFTENCKVGYIDPEGKVMIEPQFDNAMDFSEGRAFVWSYLDQKAEKAVVPLGEEYQNYETFGIGGNRKTGIIDSTGKFVVQPKVNFIVYSPFIDSIALVKIDKHFEIINWSGKVISFTDRQSYENVIRKNLIVGQSNDLQVGSKCYMTRTKEFVSGPYQNCEPYSEGLGAVSIGRKRGYVNLKGEMIIVPQFLDAEPFSNGYAVVSVPYVKEEKRSKHFGLIDRNGQFVIAPVHFKLGKASEGKIAFIEQKKGKRLFGFLNLKGEVVIKPQYQAVKPFKNGLAMIEINNKYGFINADGKMVISAKYSYASSFKHGLALVGLGEMKSAYINTKGEIVFGPWNRKCD